tara:strand:- start:150 stop:350 length:201 start_codon:yes stop_codon:yes gene_type:complete
MFNPNTSVLISSENKHQLRGYGVRYQTTNNINLVEISEDSLKKLPYELKTGWTYTNRDNFTSKNWR